MADARWHFVYCCQPSWARPTSPLRQAHSVTTMVLTAYDGGCRYILCIILKPLIGICVRKQEYFFIEPIYFSNIFFTSIGIRCGMELCTFSWYSMKTSKSSLESGLRRGEWVRCVAELRMHGWIGERRSGRGRAMCVQRSRS